MFPMRSVVTICLSTPPLEKLPVNERAWQAAIFWYWQRPATHPLSASGQGLGGQSVATVAAVHGILSPASVAPASEAPSAASLAGPPLPPSSAGICETDASVELLPSAPASVAPIPPSL